MPVDWICPDCDSPLAEGVLKCTQPGCGAELELCPHPECGQPVPVGSKFCCHCRGKIARSEPAPPPAPLPPTLDLQAASAPTVTAPATEPPPPPPALSPEVLSNLLARMTFVGTPAAPPAAPATPAPVATAAPPAERPAPQPIAPHRPAVARPAALPVFAEYQLPGTVRKGEQAFFGFKVRLPVPDPVTAVVAVRTEYLTATVRADHASGELTIPPQRYLPTLAGYDAGSVSLTVHSPDGVPLGRWVCHDLRIPIEDPAPSNLTINTQGGSVLARDLIGRSTAAGPTPPVWTPLQLAADAEYLARLSRLRPVRGGLAGGGPAVAGRQLLLAVEHRLTRRRQVYAVVLGKYAALGRGGTPTVNWWLQPEPMSEAVYLNLSRQHLHLSVRHGLAFATDGSTKGTRLNDQPLTKDEPTAVADGDDLALADGAVRFRVGVQAADGGVYAVTLRRRDALADRLSYLLLADALPVLLPVEAAAAFELLVAVGEAGQLQCSFRRDPAEALQTLPPDQPTDLGADLRVRWAALPEPQVQSRDLQFST